jgi:hypothetical protein
MARVMKYTEWDGCGPRQKIRRGPTIGGTDKPASKNKPNEKDIARVRK